MADIPAKEWTKEIEDARAVLRRRFPDLHCLRCGEEDFYFGCGQMNPVPGLASESDNRIVELICQNCGFQEKHVVRILAAATD